MRKTNRFIIDAHIDLATDLYNKYQMNVKSPLKKEYLPELKRNNVKILISSLFVSNEFLPEKGLTTALDQLQVLKDEIAENADQIMLIKTKNDLDQVMNSDKIGIVVSLEGLAPIGEDMYLLKTFYELGVRGAGLTWARRNAVADGARFGDENEFHSAGVTAFGKKVLEQMEKMGMFIDISHLNDAGAEDVFKYSESPILASHSNAREVNYMLRNISKDLTDKVIASGGMVCVNNLKPIVGVEMDSVLTDGINKLCDHIDYYKDSIGVDNIGFGFDLCNKLELSDIRYGNTETVDIDVLRNYDDSCLIAAELENRGYSRSEIDNIFGLNLLRYLQTVLK